MCQLRIPESPVVLGILFLWLAHSPFFMYYRAMFHVNHITEIKPETAAAMLCTHLTEISAHPEYKVGFRFIPEKQRYPWQYRILDSHNHDHACLYVTDTEWDRDFPYDMVDLCATWRLTPMALTVENPSDRHPVGRMWLTIHKSEPERFW